MEQNNLYQIIVNREQLQLIADCLEDISRLAAGQPELCNTINLLLALNDDDCEKRDEIQKHLYAIKKIIYPELSHNASYGYNGGSRQNSIQRDMVGNTYQIYRTILHFLAVDEKWDNVYSSSALPSGNLGTISVKKIGISD